MRYIDAGYIVVLSVLAAYGASLLARRRRLLRTVELVRARHDEP
ncbi:MAG: hypothetical protein ACYDD4_03955 [Acidimicrobiales bacterium]